MSNPFFDHPIINSPYEVPTKHWELDDKGRPTQRMLELRRKAEFINPIPRPKKRKGRPTQETLVLKDEAGISTSAQQYDPTISTRSATPWTSGERYPIRATGM